MKMTGHLLYGKYKLEKSKETKHEIWSPADKNGPLNDPFNRFIHLA